MTFEEAWEELIRLMIENKDVLIRLKEGEENEYDDLR